ncbi:hypothetical protein M0657_010121 [Pyricularia oryzae]|nr:hypothetical protein M9X92_010185 [Pyricularia oryzae]KAI7913212.1 hypothetical protein M0657_010121 [Pyricularia oryzae]
MALSRVDGLSLCRTVLALAVLDVTNKNQDALISVLFNARRTRAGARSAAGAVVATHLEC